LCGCGARTGRGSALVMSRISAEFRERDVPNGASARAHRRGGSGDRLACAVNHKSQRSGRIFSGLLNLEHSAHSVMRASR
jgi:hypothetical protein